MSLSSHSFRFTRPVLKTEKRNGFGTIVKTSDIVRNQIFIYFYKLSYFHYFSDNIKTLSSTGSVDDSFSEGEHSKVKPPAEWNRLNLDKSYFEGDAPIKTSNIRDSFIVDSSPPRSVTKLQDLQHNIQGTEKKKTYEGKTEAEEVCNAWVSENNLPGNSIERKKKNWFHFFNKKRNPGSNSSEDTHDKISLDSPLDTLGSASAGSSARSSPQESTTSKRFYAVRNSNNNDLRPDVDYGVTGTVPRIYHC